MLYFVASVPSESAVPLSPDLTPFGSSQAFDLYSEPPN